jgi:hypothetical protein
MGPFNVRRFGVPVAWLAALWSVFVLGICSMPPNDLAARMLAAVLTTFVILWFTVVRRRFEGPKVTLAFLEAKP